MVDRLVGKSRIPANIRQDIIERTDGIPLFIEEMTKAVLEAGSQCAAERTLQRVRPRLSRFPRGDTRR
jgi:predicted ATPase